MYGSFLKTPRGSPASCFIPSARLLSLLWMVREEIGFCLCLFAGAAVTNDHSRRAGLKEQKCVVLHSGRLEVGRLGACRADSR